MYHKQLRHTVYSIHISTYTIHIQSVYEVEWQVGLREDNHNSSSHEATRNLQESYKVQFHCFPHPPLNNGTERSNHSVAGIHFPIEDNTYQVKPRVHQPFVPLQLGGPGVGVLVNEHLEEQGHWYPQTNYNQCHDLQEVGIVMTERYLV